MPERLCTICSGTINPERLRRFPSTQRCETHAIKDEYSDKKHIPDPGIHTHGLAKFSMKALISAAESSQTK